LKGKNEASTNLKAYCQSIFPIVSIILPLLIVYRHDLEILANEALQNEALGHVLLIPFFAGILFYLKRDIVKASFSIKGNHNRGKMRYPDDILGVSICLVAFLIYWYGSYTFYPLELHFLSLPIFLMGVTLILFNSKAMMALVSPISFLFLLVPPPTEFIYVLGGVMANFNTRVSHIILKTFNLPVTLSLSYGPPTLMLTTSMENQTSFIIDLPCSGIYSLIAFATFAAFLAFITTASSIRKVGVLLLGFIIFDFLNIIRITSVLSIAYLFGEKLAMLLFHAVAGVLLAFIGMLITLLTAEKIFNVKILPVRKELAQCPECERRIEKFEDFCLNCGNFLNPSKILISKYFFAKTLLLLIGCSIVTLSINAPTFAIVKGIIDITSNPTWENATNPFPQIPGYQFAFLYRDRDYERVAHQDATLTYAYFPTTPNKSQSIIYVAVGMADSISNLHSWEVCLITWQTAQGRDPLVSVLDQRDIQLLPEVPVIARYLVFISPQEYTQVTLYWYEKATFRTGITIEQKYVRISLIILTQNSTQYEQFEDELFTIGKKIASHWEPLKSQSLISLGVPAQQLLLAISVAFVAFTKIAQHTNENLKRANNQKIFNNFASPKEKRTLQIIQELVEEKKMIETRNIRRALEKRIGEPVQSEELNNILNNLEKYGLVRKDIASVENRPKMIWKT